MERSLSDKFKFVSFLSMVLLVYVHGNNLNNRYVLPFTVVDEQLTFNTFVQYFLANGIFRFRIPHYRLLTFLGLPTAIIALSVMAGDPSQNGSIVLRRLDRRMRNGVIHRGTGAGELTRTRGAGNLVKRALAERHAHGLGNTYSFDSISETMYIRSPFNAIPSPC
jgi:hypothetical protein